MNPIEKLKSWIWPEREVKAETPGLPADHQHDFAELPCDMGRKVYRMCRTKGCDFNETAPLANQVRGFQDQVLGDVAEELGRRRKHR